MSLWRWLRIISLSSMSVIESLHRPFPKAISNNVILKWSRVPNACPNTTITVLNHVSLLKCFLRNQRNTNFQFAKRTFPIGLQPFSLKNSLPLVRKNTWRFPCQHETYSLEPMKKKFHWWRFFRSTCARTCRHGHPWKLKSTTIYNSLIQLLFDFCLITFDWWRKLVLRFYVGYCDW